MSINYLFGQSQETLEAALAVAQEDYMEMTALVAGGAGDVNSQRQTMGSLEKRIESLFKALRKLDPEKYLNTETVPTTRTTVNFSI